MTLIAERVEQRLKRGPPGTRIGNIALFNGAVNVGGGLNFTSGTSAGIRSRRVTRHVTRRRRASRPSDSELPSSAAIRRRAGDPLRAPSPGTRRARGDRQADHGAQPSRGGTRDRWRSERGRRRLLSRQRLERGRRHGLEAARPRAVVISSSSTTSPRVTGSTKRVESEHGRHRSTTGSTAKSDQLKQAQSFMILVTEHHAARSSRRRARRTTFSPRSATSIRCASSNGYVLGHDPVRMGQQATLHRRLGGAPAALALTEGAPRAEGRGTARDDHPNRR